MNPMRRCPSSLRCSQTGHDAGPIVDVDRRELERAGPLPERDHRHAARAQVVEQSGLVLHVAEHHDRVAVTRLQDRRQGEAFVHPAVGMPEDHVVAAGHRLDSERLDGRREKRVAEVADHRADEHRRSAAEATCQRVRAVPQLSGCKVDPFSCLGRDRHPGWGVVEDARNGAL